jgi:hypothetical protein
MAPLDPRARAGLALAVALAALAATATAVGLRQLRPPPPRGADAPGPAFSAERADAVLRVLAGDGTPRPTGSPANAAGARRVAQAFRALGLETRVQETFACGAWRVCADVRNVVARVPAAPGAEGRRAVLLVAHHDSAIAGPGIADDLASVAALVEVARALRAGPPPPRPVLLLATDGEETGLVGVTAFYDRHPWAREVGAAVNLEARGTSGPSIMFDTSADPGWLVAALRRLPRPVTTSIAPALYDLIPNDTDLTVLEARGLPGLNFAFADGVVRYHTRADDLAHLSRGSLQHQGDHALAAARALADADLERPGRGRWIFFDVLALFVVWWPERAAAPAAGAVLALALLAAVLLRVRVRVRLAAVAVGVAAAILAPLLAGALALALRATLALLGAVPRPFVASPGPLAVAVGCSGLAGALAAAAALGGRAGPHGLLAGAALVDGALALATAILLPGASYVFLVPAAFAAAGALAWAIVAREQPGLAAGTLLAAASGLVLLPAAGHLLPMLGAPAAPIVAALVALAAQGPAAIAAGMGTPARARAAGAVAAAAVLAAAVAAVLPHATEDAPEWMSIAYHAEDGRGRWLVEAQSRRLPGALRDAARFSEAPAPAFEWFPIREVFAAEAPRLGVPAPRAEVLAVERTAGGRRLRIRLASRRAAPLVLLALPPEVEVRSVSVGGAPAGPPAPKTRMYNGGWHLLGCATTPREGVEVDLEIGAGEPFDAVVVDESPGLPRAAAPLLAARPREAAPWWDGDQTIATARVRL